MQINLQADEASIWIICWICSMIIVCSITFSVLHYNIRATELYTKGGYEEVSDKGTSIIYWRKAK